MPSTSKSAEYSRRWYAKNKKLQIERNQAAKQRRRDWLNDYKRNLGCRLCGEREPIALDLHHRDPETKDIDLSIAIVQRSKAFVEEELKKCEVLCANCHRKFHAGIVQLD